MRRGQRHALTHSGAAVFLLLLLDLQACLQCAKVGAVAAEAGHGERAVGRRGLRDHPTPEALGGAPAAQRCAVLIDYALNVGDVSASGAGTRTISDGCGSGNAFACECPAQSNPSHSCVVPLRRSTMDRGVDGPAIMMATRNTPCCHAHTRHAHARRPHAPRMPPMTTACMARAYPAQRTRAAAPGSIRQGHTPYDGTVFGVCRMDRTVHTAYDATLACVCTHAAPEWEEEAHRTSQATTTQQPAGQRCP